MCFTCDGKGTRWNHIADCVTLYDGRRGETLTEDKSHTLLHSSVVAATRRCDIAMHVAEEIGGHVNKPLPLLTLLPSAKSYVEKHASAHEIEARV